MSSSGTNIFLFDGAGISQLSDNTDYTSYGPEPPPRINTSGSVVWADFATARVYLHDGTGIIQLTENGSSSTQCSPRINSRGHVVWTECEGPWPGQHCAIFLYDGTTAVPIAEASDPYCLQFADNGMISWGSDRELFLAVPDDVAFWMPASTFSLDECRHAGALGYIACFAPAGFYLAYRKRACRHQVAS